MSALLLLATVLAGPPPPPPPPSGGGGGVSTPAARDPASSPAPQSSLPGDITGQRRPSEDLTDAWKFSHGEALTPNFVDDEPDRVLSINPIGFYQGVTLDGTRQPPFAVDPATAQASDGPTFLTWSGFERGPNSSRVFFQLNRAVDPQVQNDGLRIDITLPNTQVNVKNNRRYLDTRFFRTPVLEVQIDGPRQKRRKRRRKAAASGDTKVTVLLRAAVAPEIRVQAAPNGYHMLVLEFPDDARSEGVVVETAQGGAPPPPKSGD